MSHIFFPKDYIIIIQSLLFNAHQGFETCKARGVYICS